MRISSRSPLLLPCRLFCTPLHSTAAPPNRSPSSPLTRSPSLPFLISCELLGPVLAWSNTSGRLSLLRMQRRRSSTPQRQSRRHNPVEYRRMSFIRLCELFGITASPFQLRQRPASVRVLDSTPLALYAGTRCVAPTQSHTFAHAHTYTSSACCSPFFPPLSPSPSPSLSPSSSPAQPAVRTLCSTLLTHNGPSTNPTIRQAQLVRK